MTRKSFLSRNRQLLKTFLEKKNLEFSPLLLTHRRVKARRVLATWHRVRSAWLAAAAPPLEVLTRAVYFSLSPPASLHGSLRHWVLLLLAKGDRRMCCVDVFRILFQSRYHYRPLRWRDYWLHLPACWFNLSLISWTPIYDYAEILMCVCVSVWACLCEGVYVCACARSCVYFCTSVSRFALIFIKDYLEQNTRTKYSLRLLQGLVRIGKHFVPK